MCFGVRSLNNLVFIKYISTFYTQMTSYPLNEKESLSKKNRPKFPLVIECLSKLVLKEKFQKF